MGNGGRNDDGGELDRIVGLGWSLMRVSRSPRRLARLCDGNGKTA